MYLDEYLKIHSKKYLVFDLDETLAWLKIDWSGFRDGFFEVVKRFDPSMVELVDRYQDSSRGLYNELVYQQGFGIKQVMDTFYEHFELSNYHGIVVNDELVDFIHRNHDQYTMVVWTNQSRKMALKALKELKLEDVFEKVIAKENKNLAKPNPDGFYTFFEPGVHTRSEFLMLGDSDADEMACLRAGIDFLRVKMKFNEQ